jgi:hypothetical protein
MYVNIIGLYRFFISLKFIQIGQGSYYLKLIYCRKMNIVRLDNPLISPICLYGSNLLFIKVSIIGTGHIAGTQAKK